MSDTYFVAVMLYATIVGCASDIVFKSEVVGVGVVIISWSLALLSVGRL